MPGIILLTIKLAPVLNGIRSLSRWHKDHLFVINVHGDDFKIECPIGSSNMRTFFEVSMEIAQRLTRIFLKDEQGKRPVFGGSEKFQTDPYWRDYILFYEYFHGDNGAGLGASHQTGWTGLVARLIQLNGFLTPEIALNSSDSPLRILYRTSKD